MKEEERYKKRKEEGGYKKVKEEEGYISRGRI